MTRTTAVNRPTLAVVLAVVLAALAATGGAATASALRPAVTHTSTTVRPGPHRPAPTEHIDEDDPRWDCATMGNRVCGPTATSTATVTVVGDVADPYRTLPA